MILYPAVVPVSAKSTKLHSFRRSALPKSSGVFTLISNDDVTSWRFQVQIPLRRCRRPLAFPENLTENTFSLRLSMTQFARTPGVIKESVLTLVRVIYVKTNNNSLRNMTR